MTRYGMAIDKKRCIACNTCCVACKIENNLPQNMWWNRVINEGGPNPDSPAGTYPELTMTTYTLSCQHCANPACLPVCPTGATTKDPDTGIVMVDPHICIGCQACIAACPYGVRTLLAEEPTYYTAFNVGGDGIQEHVANTVEKCTFCAHRVANGEDPFCVEVCPGRARVFGDLDDPESEISKLIASRDYEQLLPEAGTEPSVFLLV